MPPRKVYIDVYIDEIEPELQFRVESSPLNDPPLPTGPNGIIFQNDHHEGFDVYFELKGNTFGYYFPNDKREALWSQLGSVCPTKTGVWDVLDPKKVFDPSYPIPPRQRTLLWARNPNQKTSNGKGQGPFQFNLRVFNAANKRLDLDPGGENMNGPTRESFDWTAIITGIGCALATTAALAGAAYLAGLQLVSRV